LFEQKNTPHTMEKIIGIHLNVPMPASRIIWAAIRKARIDFPRDYSYAPHVTLYLGRFPAGHFAKLTQILNTLKLGSVVLRINAIRIQHQTETDFLSLTFVPNSRIKKLQQQILEPANTLRGHLLRSKDKNRLKNGFFNTKEKHYLLKYGSPWVLALHTPHITLGEVPAPRSTQTIEELVLFLRQLKKMKLNISKIVVGLYNYDSKQKKYTKVIREEKIRLK
jgi:hypothetical protein